MAFVIYSEEHTEQPTEFTLVDKEHWAGMAAVHSLVFNGAGYHDCVDGAPWTLVGAATHGASQYGRHLKLGSAAYLTRAITQKMQITNPWILARISVGSGARHIVVSRNYNGSTVPWYFNASTITDGNGTSGFAVYSGGWSNVPFATSINGAGWKTVSAHKSVGA